MLFTCSLIGIGAAWIIKGGNKPMSNQSAEPMAPPEPMARLAAADFCQESLHNRFLLLVMGFLTPFPYSERFRRRIPFDMFTDGRRVAVRIKAADSWNIFHLCIIFVIYIQISSITFSNQRVGANAIPTSMPHFHKRFNGNRGSKESMGTISSIINRLGIHGILHICLIC
jgi:hypothetical protein